MLKKREAYREDFDGLDPYKVALYSSAKIEELRKNEGIIRNRLKINAAINNAKLFLEVIEKHGSFDKFIWGYVDYKPVEGHWEKMGFKFVGLTIIYSFMQATGMVNDHITSCFVYEELIPSS